MYTYWIITNIHTLSPGLTGEWPLDHADLVNPKGDILALGDDSDAGRIVDIWQIVLEHGIYVMPIPDGVAHHDPPLAPGHDAVVACRDCRSEVGAIPVGRADVDGDEVLLPRDEAGLVELLVHAPHLALVVLVVLVEARLLTLVELVRRDAEGARVPGVEDAPRLRGARLEASIDDEVGVLWLGLGRGGGRLDARCCGGLGGCEDGGAVGGGCRDGRRSRGRSGLDSR